MEMLTCTKCGRTRPRATKSGYVLVKLTKTYSGKKKYRCTARSVCASIARRKRDRSHGRP